MKKIEGGNEPLVSILTPVFNGESFLKDCVESVLAQTYQSWEYIIVNNCSTDNTIQIALNYAEREPRIKVHSNKSFVGVIENHNIAFRLISPESKYCKVVSADDWLFPCCLEKMVALAEDYPTVGIVGSYLLVGKKIMCQGLEYERKVVSGNEISRETLLGGPYVFGAPTTILYRSDLIRSSRDFFPGSNPHADTTACYQSLKQTDFGFVHQILSYTRIHSETQSSRSIKFGTIRLSSIGDLIRFGPDYLNEKELRKRLKIRINKNYNFLATKIIAYLRDSEFREQQRKGFHELGMRFSYLKLCKAIILKVLYLFVRPGKAMKKIMEIKDQMKNGSKIEARYF